MACIDLSYPIEREMPVYPGEEKPVLRPAARINRDGYRELRIEMNSHTGTHIDAPAHMLPEGRTLDGFPVSHFTDKAAVIRIPGKTSLIETSFLVAYGERIENCGYLLLATGWSRHWGDHRYFTGYPVLTEEAAMWLGSLGLKGIGLDVVSVDPVESENWPVHHIFFNAGMVIVENLVFPADFDPGHALFHCFPLRISGADGSPVRAVAVV
jgi:kynurenine formamidase